MIRLHVIWKKVILQAIKLLDWMKAVSHLTNLLPVVWCLDALKYNLLLFHVWIEKNNDGVVIFCFLIGSSEHEGKCLLVNKLLQVFTIGELLDLHEKKTILKCF